MCEVLDYELTHGGALLEPSPGYWGPRLPGGYLRTVPSAALIRHFAAHAPQLAAAAAEGGGGRRRLGVVFGVDNLGGMASWERPAQMLAQADVVLVARAAARVTFGADPSDLLGAIRHLAILAAVPVFAPKRGDDDDAPLFGPALGHFANGGAGGESALFLLPPLVGADEHLSSTKLRDALANGAAGGDATLGAHGYASPAALVRSSAPTAAPARSRSSRARRGRAASGRRRVRDNYVSSAYEPIHRRRRRSSVSHAQYDVLPARRALVERLRALGAHAVAARVERHVLLLVHAHRALLLLGALLGGGLLNAAGRGEHLGLQRVERVGLERPQRRRLAGARARARLLRLVVADGLRAHLPPLLLLLVLLDQRRVDRARHVRLAATWLPSAEGDEHVARLDVVAGLDRDRVDAAGAGAATVVSIFIADSTSIGVPSSTGSPIFTLVSTTTPGIGAPTPPGTSAALARTTLSTARCGR